MNNDRNGDDRTMEPEAAAFGISQRTKGHEISCDQVAWLLAIFDRYLPCDGNPAISRAREMKKYALLYEVMDVAELEFRDAAALWNGTPNDVRSYKPEDA